MKLKPTSAPNFPPRKNLGFSRSFLGAQASTEYYPPARISHAPVGSISDQILHHDWGGYKKETAGRLSRADTTTKSTKHRKGCRPAFFMRLSDPRTHKYRTTTLRLPGSRFHNKTPLSNGAAYNCGQAREGLGTVSVAFASHCKAPHLTSTRRHRTIR